MFPFTNVLSLFLQAKIEFDSDNNEERLTVNSYCEIYKIDKDDEFIRNTH